MLLHLLLSSSLFILKCESANILGVFLHTAFSHQVAFRPLWRELSLRGHKVTVLTSDPINDPTLTNLTEIDLSPAYATWTSTDIIEYSEQHTLYETVPKLIEIGVNVVDVEMSLPEVQDLLNNANHSFDLVIAELFYPLGMLFSEKFDCPLVTAFSQDAIVRFDEIIGNSGHTLQCPLYLLPFDHPLDLIARVVSVAVYFMESLLTSQMEAGFAVLNKKYFGDSVPSLGEILDQRLSLMISYWNPAFGNMRPMSPAFIALGGGTHMEPPKDLPEDLKQFLDNATEGAVYFSLGSNPFSKSMPLDRRKIIAEALSELPFKILWKFEAEDFEGRPENVKLSKWLPQQDVLRHPNLKVFVTQGGLQSIEEALSTHVPLVVMSKMADQHFNAKRVVNKGMGLRVDFTSVTKEELKETTLEVANNPKYRNRMKELDDFAKDQPMKPIDKAIWWIEYVIRHNGTTHLKGSLSGKSFYQHVFPIEVLAVITVTVVCVIIVCQLLIRVLRSKARNVGRKKDL